MILELVFLTFQGASFA